MDSDQKPNNGNESDNFFIDEQRCQPVKRTSLAKKNSKEPIATPDNMQEATVKEPDEPEKEEEPKVAPVKRATPIKKTASKEEVAKEEKEKTVESALKSTKMSAEKTAGDEKKEENENVVEEEEKKKPPKKSGTDENNAIGQICDEVSFDEDKKKKKGKTDTAEANPDNAVGQLCSNDDVSFADAKNKKKPKKQKPKGTIVDKSTRFDEKKKKKDIEKSSYDNEKSKDMEGSTRIKKGGAGGAKKDKLGNSQRKTKSSYRYVPKKNEKTPELKKKGSDRRMLDRFASKKRLVKPKKDGRKKELKTEGFFKYCYNKAKETIAATSARLNKADDTFIVTPEAHMKMNDVIAEYGGPDDYGAAPEKPHDNFDNEGNLFPKGRPFWCIKDEVPPKVNTYVMNAAIRELAEGKWVLLGGLKDPKDLDPYNTLETMQSRDAEYFKKDLRILSSTVRSLVALYESKHRIKKKEKDAAPSSDSFRDPSVTPSNHTTTTITTNKHSVGFTEPKQLVQYNRKNRYDPMKRIAYTPGIAKKTKKKRDGVTMDESMKKRKGKSTTSSSTTTSSSISNVNK